VVNFIGFLFDFLGHPAITPRAQPSLSLFFLVAFVNDDDHLSRLSATTNRQLSQEEEEEIFNKTGWSMRRKIIAS
jgi:hypothetical protein